MAAKKTGFIATVKEAVAPVATRAASSTGSMAGTTRSPVRM